MAWAAAIPAVIGGISSLIGGERANRSRRDMADNAHQREVEDLRKAGLNPILSGTGGAGSPVAQVEDAVGPAVNSALAQRMVTQEIRNARLSGQVLVNQRDKLAAEAQTALTQSGVEFSTAMDVRREQIKQLQLTNTAIDADNTGRVNQAEFENKRVGEAFKGNWRDWEMGDIRRMMEAILSTGNSARSLAR